jgi:Fanconi-associated nuclease 1
MKYPSKEEEDEVKDAKKERMARRRLKEALALCLEGLEDPFTHLSVFLPSLLVTMAAYVIAVYKASLRRRIVRIESKLKVEKADKHTFEKGLGKAPVRIMEGDRLDDPTPGHHSIWRADDGEEISVEELVLAQYVKEGWSG